ncbi:tRNA:m(5)U-54 MTase gid [Desulfurella amilsii]|uniref:Methylenetetrahydrofolate--tRNA-(uracil-5-)-methyltransferase TrmFO n=1 Tax=Desulfurella amilsii TaxID=1562698 RepID=A0A1X4XW34_9BACT|nr:methylenetetrahydrofolate--tRNA-(uracil(54)-C(5))-methyltransferase (FADH(2)-oxidizing) TrmFO [Desulfurella amilsii]OSS41747.1 tRNA:m(5)U-54 MTase gid [Desulfurella amilsii]
MRVCIIGGGLAGCEVAYKIAQNGFAVDMYEMRPIKQTPAHLTDYLAEIVCSNSFGAKSIKTASGLLKKEMKLLGSLVISVAKTCVVPAGRALAIDRTLFAKNITQIIEQHPNINIIRKEMKKLPVNYDLVVISSGPLTSQDLENEILNITGKENLYFYDAIAPHIITQSVDFSKGFFANRYEEGLDYFNCVLSKEEYEEFYNALVKAECVAYKDFEKPRFFEGCMPVEELAKRGFNTLCFGPMKPVGLAKHGFKPYAVVQLRKENASGTILSMVGFQTKLTYKEQITVFRLIPALKNAEFAKLGSMHRNTYLQSQHLLTPYLNLKSMPNIFFAGQITGVEGYIASAASGLFVGINISRLLKDMNLISLPPNTMLGGLINYISQPKDTLQPMGPNFGLIETPFPKLEKAKRALKSMFDFCKSNDLF